MFQAPSSNKEVEPAALHATAVQLVCLVGCYWQRLQAGGGKRLSLIPVILLGHLKAGFEKKE